MQITIARGLIEGAGGKTVFATNRSKRIGGQTLYFRRYPQHGLAAQTVGYSTVRTLAGRPRALDERLPHRREHRT